MKTLKEYLAPSVLQMLRALVGRWNYEIVRRPSAFRSSPDAEIQADLSLILSHFALSHPELSFVQIGAFDGQMQDPLTQFLAKFPWGGVLVEPQPDVFERLQAHYKDHPNLTLVQAAIGPRDGELPFYRVRRDPNVPDWAQMIASFDRSLILRHKGLIPNIENYVDEISVKTYTFSSLLSFAGLERCDLIQIDAEGFDFEIVKMIDLEKIKPAIINFELVHLSEDDREASLKYLADRGYRLGIGCGRDVVAYLKEYF